MSSDQTFTYKPDETITGIRGKYINDPRILKEVSAIEAFLWKHFLQSRNRQN